MSQRIAIDLSDRERELLDDAVLRGEFASREAAVHDALERVLSGFRHDQIEDAYRLAYGEVPEEEIWGEVGERLAAESLRDRRR